MFALKSFSPALAALLLLAVPAPPASAQTAANNGNAVTAPAPPAAPAKPATADTKPALSMDQVLDRVVQRENALVKSLAHYSPLVETYIQDLTPNADLGTTPKDDKYFLGKLDLTKGINEHSLLPEPGFGGAVKDALAQIYSVRYLPNGFAQMMILDGSHFDKTNYSFEFVRREFLGEVRCLVFEVHPKPDATMAHFIGRIWVEDQDDNIVRFNGTYGPASSSKMYFHFDSWREYMGPGVWLPSYVYSEESDLGYFVGMRKLQFKGQTRIWGYNVRKSSAENDFTSIKVDADKVDDEGDAAEHISPVLSLREWERQAEDNVLQRMEKAGLLAPAGDVDKVLETVVNNIEVTNNLDIEPEIHCRVMLTTPLESFSVGHTIIISRGLIDVLPDEASLAMILAHELAHIALGHRLDTKYAFDDRMQFKDEDTFNRIVVRRDEKEEKEADEKAVALLENSPYKDKLGKAGLFLKELNERAKDLPNLLQAHMGNPLAHGHEVLRMGQLMQSAPQLQDDKTDQIAALPIGGRLNVDPWSNRIELVKTKPVELLSAREKMPFEVTPIYLYLTRNLNKPTPAAANNN